MFTMQRTGLHKVSEKREHSAMMHTFTEEIVAFRKSV